MNDELARVIEHTSERLRRDCSAMRALVGELGILTQATRVALASGNQKALEIRLDEIDDWFERHSVAFCRLLDSIQMAYYVDYLLKGDDGAEG